MGAHHRQPRSRPGQALSSVPDTRLLPWPRPQKALVASPGQSHQPLARPVPPRSCKSKRPSERVRPSVRGCVRAAVGVAAILNLMALLPVVTFPCRAPRPQHPDNTTDNTTASKLLGTWLYVAGAAQFPQHLLELLLIDHGHLDVEPRARERELLITQRVAVGDQCLTNNSTYFEIRAGNTTLVKHAKTQQTVGTLMNLSSEDLLLIQYQLQRERTYLGLYLYARNLSVSTAHREEFEHQAKRLGLSQEEIVYAPWKTELCQTKEDDKRNSPCTEPAAAVTASPPPGTQQPGRAGNEHHPRQ
ncbi:alpha-1-acid glycoprotein 8-like [Antrostomus carolinensis]|uniref:alpha-1-acid glycoprotein 8-like n=1 Tax=Antrostomus carolinensis TaxID=279965 RepID=UPI0010A992EE|nr:alpha-1-acid glycoprotein 8-like [Antrostomus carolinensis]